MLVRALILATVITVMSSTAFSYTDEEMHVLLDDCETSLALQRQFNSNLLITFRDITLRTGDNCQDLIRLGLSRFKSTQQMQDWDRKMACLALAQDTINNNGGRQAMPLPDHLERQWRDTVVDGMTCEAIHSKK